MDGLLVDHGLFHLEADLRWIDLRERNARIFPDVIVADDLDVVPVPSRARHDR